MRNKPKKVNFTQDSLEKLKPQDKPYTVYDSKTRGLCVIVYPSGTKTFFVYRKPAGAKRPVRVKIGKFNDFPLSGDKSVRERATAINYDLNKGINPVTERKEARKVKETKGATLDYPVIDSEGIIDTMAVSDFKSTSVTRLMRPL